MIRKLEKLAAAVAFAEANEHRTALEVLEELKGNYPTASRKIVMVCNGEPMKTGLVEYGLGLACRMHYQSLFLSVFPKRPAESEFQRLAERDRATLNGLAKSVLEHGGGTDLYTGHAALWGDWRSLVKDACHRLGGVEMVILQKRKSAPCASGLTVPVFCLNL